MTIKGLMYRILTNGIRTSVSLLGEKNKYLALSKLVEELPPIYTQNTRFGKIFFFCIGELSLWRAETLFTKEPETIEWIDSFAENDILYDIGANIGCYSLYAATKGSIVFSFEPAAVNYFLLQKNIEINHLDSKMQAFCIACNDVSQIGFLHMSTTQVGGAVHSFGNSSEKFAFMGDEWAIKFKQGMIGYSIDDFILKYNLIPPNHIKIDVDGIEDKIIRGATKTLVHQNVKSILVELDTTQVQYKETIQLIESLGLKLTAKKHAPIFDNGPYSTIYNHIFIRSHD